MYRSFLGLLVMLAILYFFSSNRRCIDWKLVFGGLSLQVIFALLIIKVPGVKDVFAWIASFFILVLDFSAKGAEFVFGPLSSPQNSLGFVFAFRVLPTVVFFSALSSLLYYLGILQQIIYGLSWMLTRFLKLSGAESLAVAANVFIGQTEAPLLIRPYIEKMNTSEILCLMSGGMATIAGSVFAAYVGFLGGSDESMQQFFATHLLCASIMSAPASVVCAKMLVPQTESINTKSVLLKTDTGTSPLDAITKGTTEGLKLAVNVAAMLLVFTALIYMLDTTVMAVVDAINAVAKYVMSSSVGDWNATIRTQTNQIFQGIGITYIMGCLFMPIAWLLGTPEQDILSMGLLLGQKTIINEFYAYSQIPSLHLQPKTVLIATYALCGFSNFASVGIQIGGIGSLAPSKRDVLIQLSPKALLAGTIACLMTACIASVLV